MTPQCSKIKKQYVLSRIDARMDWICGRIGILTSNEVKDTIHVDFPAGHDNPGSGWNPEYLILSAVMSAVMNACLGLSDERKEPFSHLECVATGKLENGSISLRLISLDVHMTAFVAEGRSQRVAVDFMDEAWRRSGVEDVLKVPVSFNGSVATDPHSRLSSFAVVK